MKQYPCPCCGFYTRSEAGFGTFDICPICGWEDDFFQANNPDNPSGANHISLNQARENYKKYGYCCERMRKRVRLPNNSEKKII